MILTTNDYLNKIEEFPISETEDIVILTIQVPPGALGDAPGLSTSTLASTFDGDGPGFNLAPVITGNESITKPPNLTPIDPTKEPSVRGQMVMGGGPAPKKVEPIKCRVYAQGICRRDSVVRSKKHMDVSILPSGNTEAHVSFKNKRGEVCYITIEYKGEVTSYFYNCKGDIPKNTAEEPVEEPKDYDKLVADARG